MKQTIAGIPVYEKYSVLIAAKTAAETTAPDADTVITIGCNFTQGDLANSITAYMAEITTTFDS